MLELKEVNKALTQTKVLYEQERAEKEQLRGLHEDYKAQFETVTAENAQISKKLADELVQKRQRREQADVEADRLKDEIQKRQ